ncbi:MULTISPECIES: hypothetical protein [Methylosinus]|uniref:Uncharacterized protein n=1 Tax=Methylosinus trichosporium (strain ATCC 35070 / NCIMB 11131 / UNIQEM 75 / OB3b) TaxID=595536 RepID=A0A2D2CYA9_METT3|nr:MULTISPECIES: hypothetical protein [Methylosinus]ATQ67706.1 hypothetical protein CQW49_07240 [Methylosinus trichosporium OB3b]OBS51186.1 hypothetical protein A8B73_17870 [Methylosinus sp. 3S-1]
MSRDETLIAEADQNQIRDHALSIIATHQGAWARAAEQHPENARFFALLQRTLARREADAPSLAREAARFLVEIRDARYREATADLDFQLARRELNFLLVLLAAIVENRRLARLERARGRLGDVEWTLRVERIRRQLATVGRLTGESGYLTQPPEFEFMTDWSSQVSNDLARAILGSLRGRRRDVARQIAHFLPRYGLDAARRNWFRLLVVSLVFGWLVNFIMQLAQVSTFTLLGLGLLAIGKLGPIVFEKLLARRWLEAHRAALRRATFRLYRAYAEFLPDRAFLDAMHELSEEQVRRALWPAASEDTSA